MPRRILMSRAYQLTHDPESLVTIARSGRRGDNSQARRRARMAGHSQKRVGQKPFQLGGSFVFGPGNVNLYTHISETFGDNASPEALLAAIPTARTSTKI